MLHELTPLGRRRWFCQAFSAENEMVKSTNRKGSRQGTGRLREEPKSENTACFPGFATPGGEAHHPERAEVLHITNPTIQQTTVGLGITPKVVCRLITPQECLHERSSQGVTILARQLPRQVGLEECASQKRRSLRQFQDNGQKAPGSSSKGLCFCPSMRDWRRA